MIDLSKYEKLCNAPTPTEAVKMINENGKLVKSFGHLIIDHMTEVNEIHQALGELNEQMMDSTSDEDRSAIADMIIALASTTHLKKHIYGAALGAVLSLPINEIFSMYKVAYEITLLAGEQHVINGKTTQEKLDEIKKVESGFPYNPDRNDPLTRYGIRNLKHLRTLPVMEDWGKDD